MFQRVTAETEEPVTTPYRRLTWHQLNRVAGADRTDEIREQVRTMSILLPCAVDNILGKTSSFIMPSWGLQWFLLSSVLLHKFKDTGRDKEMQKEERQKQDRGSKVKIRGRKMRMMRAGRQREPRFTAGEWRPQRGESTFHTEQGRAHRQRQHTSCCFLCLPPCQCRGEWPSVSLGALLSPTFTAPIHPAQCRRLSADWDNQSRQVQKAPKKRRLRWVLPTSGPFARERQPWPCSQSSTEEPNSKVTPSPS